MALVNSLINLNDFQIVNQIGKSSDHLTFLVKWIRDQKMYLAKEYFIDISSDSSKQTTFMHIINNFQQIQHPTIVKFYGFSFNSIRDRNNSNPTLIFEYYSNGSLQDLIERESKSICPPEFNTTTKMKILIGISYGMKLLHDHNIIHKYLKPSNILLDSNFSPKICDFGLSKTYDCKEKYPSKGTFRYIAPEIFEYEIFSDKSDVYSFGMMMYELVGCHDPFLDFDKNNFQRIRKILNGYRPNFSEHISESAKKLIESCWNSEPAKRPSFEEIYEKLSSSFREFDADVDAAEIKEYISYIQDQEKANFHCIDSLEKIKQENERLQQENKELRDEIERFKEKENESAFSRQNFISGLVSLHGNKHEKNYKSATNYLKRSSESGNSYASFLLGLLYENGEGVAQDINKAFELFNESFSQGNISGLNRIGLSYMRGITAPKDQVKAAEYFKLGAELGDPASLNNLGLCYELGQGFEVDFPKAIECYQKSAESKYALAINNIAVCYRLGNGFDKNLSKAVEYYKSAAEFDEPEAMKNLGILYFNGIGVEKDLKQAHKYFSEAAELGNIESMKNLAFILEKGLGCDCDFPKAMKYYKNAAELGNKAAQKRLEYEKRKENNQNKESETQFTNQSKENSEQYIKELESQLINQRKEYEEKIEKQAKELNKIIETLQSQKDPKENKIQFLDEDSMKNIETITEIGDGFNSRVFSVCKKSLYAMKVLKNIDFKSLKYIFKEYELIFNLNHPSILKAYGFYFGSNEIKPSILLEFCSTNLEKAIYDNLLSNLQISFAIYQIAETMKYVHSKGIIHSKLKPSNIFVEEDGTIKIGDLGCSKLMEDEIELLNIGSKQYISPEIFYEKNYDEKVDVYSFGVTILMMMSRGKFPKITIRDKITGKKPEIPEFFTSFSKQLISSCLNFESRDRPSFKDICCQLEQSKNQLVELKSVEQKELLKMREMYKKKLPVCDT